MRIIALILFLNIFGVLNAQNQTTKKEILSIFKETLTKSRDFVSEATNEWFFDNTNNDYSKKDTIVLNSARIFKRDYCNIINWSFYSSDNFVLEKADYCNEPPTKLISKNKDSINIKIKELNNVTYLNLYNINGLFETYRILYLKTNETSDEDNSFDYTLKLLRIE
ncbi:hypothetical protein [uncultured Aquimarina sp.]|uniref:hypothetical protein n=1 Tax=uncultured Aquimarina sp. TaxID=575652 RepID=UPI00260D543D|nr:hypothetical protein [uncultured Aquimarina sp.]